MRREERLLQSSLHRQAADEVLTFDLLLAEVAIGAADVLIRVLTSRLRQVDPRVRPQGLSTKSRISIIQQPFSRSCRHCIIDILSKCPHLKTHWSSTRSSVRPSLCDQLLSGSNKCQFP